MQCKQRHAYICSEFEKSGKCAKGKYCPYPHKVKSLASSSKSNAVKVIRPSSSNKAILNHQLSGVTGSSEDSRKRYYDKTSPSDEQLAEMRKDILKKMNSMKASLGFSKSTVPSRDDTITTTGSSDEMIDDDVQESDCNIVERPKRPPIGPLPAYIPIN